VVVLAMSGPDVGRRPVRAAALCRARWRLLPGEVAAMAVMNAVAFVGCLLGAIVPMSAHTPVRLNLVLAVVALVLGAINVGFGTRLPRWLLHGQLALVAAGAGLSIARSHTAAGAMVTASAFPWLAVYAAMFFTKRQAHVHAALFTIAVVAGMLLSPAAVPPGAWAVIIASFWAAIVVLGNVSRRLRDLAVTDALTGLVNRGGFLQAAERELARAARTAEPLCVVMIDLDGLKAVNDADGHRAGDVLLADAAAAWARVLRGHDVLARIGGDEFVVLAPDTTRAQADAFVARMRLAHPARWSAGVSQWRPGEPLDACLERADAALYAHKATRRRDPEATLEATG